MGELFVRDDVRDFGDIHGNLEALEAVLEDMEAQAIDQAVCIGDIIGNWANSRECIEIVRALGCPIVKGNHEARACENVEVDPPEGKEFSKIRFARSQLTWEQREFLRVLPLQRRVDSFTVVHSNLEQPDRWSYVLSSSEVERSFQHQKTDVCFFGHTHIPHVFIRDTTVHEFYYKKVDVQPDKKYFVNVGSVGEPRDGDWRAASAIYDTDANTIELRRLPFDLAKAQAKIRGA